VNRAIDWFARNPVAANLLMVLIIASGVAAVFSVKKEVFPEFDLDQISISVRYLGATPAEVEEAVCVRVEEAIQGIDGIKRITSTASEGSGRVLVELQLGASVSKVLDDVKSQVDAIDTFPEETEKPIIQEVTARRQVIDVAVWGDADERTLKVVAERVRDDLLAIPGITQVDLTNARPYEISIEVSEEKLRRYGLTFEQVARAVRISSLDLPAGSVKTGGGEVLLRTKGQAYRGREFEDLVLLSRRDGTHVRLGQVAEVVDGFADTDQLSRFQGKPALVIQIYRTGEQAALDIAEKVHGYIETAGPALPEGLFLTAIQDSSKILRDRLDLLMRNGRNGFILVVLTLALVLRFRLAFWVSLGIPVSFLGALWLLPGLDVSINMLSLFAFIVVLGIVVDDAIIVGENVFTHQSRHGRRLRGAVEGTQEVAVPVIFAVLTTVAAFMPLLSIEGTMGKLMRNIPLVVIPCLLFSLLECLFILPAHLSHMKKLQGPNGTGKGRAAARPEGVWGRFQTRVAGGLDWFINHAYRPALELGLKWRYATAALGAATLIVTLGYVGGGWIDFVFMPPVESDYISASLTMPQGTPVEVTSEAVRVIEESAERVRQEMIDETGNDPFRTISASIGGQSRARQGPPGMTDNNQVSAAHLGEIFIELAPTEERDFTSTEAMNRWRERTAAIPDVVELKFNASLLSAGEDINVQLTGPDIDDLRATADELKNHLAEYAGVYEIADSFREGKKEIKLRIKPSAEVLGLTLVDLGRQVRQAFYGEEAQRIQRGRDDVRVMVRYPESERRSVGDLENMRVRTPDGKEVPFHEVAVVEQGRGYATITRVDRRRAVNVTADVDEDQTTSGRVLADLRANVIPKILAAHPGVAYTLEGTEAQMRDSMGGLERGFAIALILIYALLAVPLRSYVQPLVIMTAIPFGIVGAIWGHIIMGMPLTILSMFGIVALAGVVVNDSLVMVDFINRNRQSTGDLATAVRQAGVVRFRPILLTSLTTFFGLLPLLLEKSMQAKFMVPMAISLGFGVIFSTFISLVLVPAGYMIIEDLKVGLGKLPRFLRRVYGLELVSELEGVEPEPETTQPVREESVPVETPRA
jgi:multidrug efflux pump subunit AcrB